MIDDKDFIQKLAEFTAKGIRLASEQPAVQKRTFTMPGAIWLAEKERHIGKKSYIPPILANLQPELLSWGWAQDKKLTWKKGDGCPQARSYLSPPKGICMMIGLTLDVRIARSLEVEN